ncbi:sorbosone dehydrogenase family protein [Hyphomicrobium sp.]|uniref:PQQ-dependent sugar dehydrogenase n=1 Tax=Hyphomicrobium sp. TaxID=82 RepID=UPI000FB5203C|nr:sorbosone dehydrogenase family protein [Hyphomicrobium sp.]RUO97455.1 MAG: sorbosone dehydrogenase family protein [Hyphomicrobium sp.]
MLLRSVAAFTGITAVFTVWAIAVSADDAKRGDFGPNPELPAPQSNIVPTIKVAPVVGWKDNAKPSTPGDLNVAAYATGLDHPRWLYVLPNGDILVAETNGPTRPEDGKGIKGWFQALFQKYAGARVPSPNRITLLRGIKPDGTAETRSVFIDGLNSPFGMALVGNALYVADTDALLKFDYHAGDTKITAQPVKVADLPGGPLNHHWTKNVIASADGSKLYVTVGSNSNAGENGLEKETDRARIIEIDPKTGTTRPFATGLRNPNGMAFEPETKDLWTVVNERDELGDDLVPDYLTSVKDGAFYGWPFSYYGQHLDPRLTKEERPDLVAKAIAPDYAIGAHTASLGLTFSSDKSLPARFAHGAFIGQHGSWNRSQPSGYKVIFVPFANGKPSGDTQDVLTGFLDADGNARGRPVGVTIAQDGALIVADDVGNAIWRVTASGRTAENTAR